MRERNAVELEQARRDAAERFREIGLAILKEAGCQTWEFHTSGLRGRAWPKRQHVTCPDPTTRRRLYILAHECAHIALNHVGSKPSHRRELEAELYAHDALRRHGVAVPKRETDRARKYVAYCIDKAVRLGKASKLDREALEWSRPQLAHATLEALRQGRVELVDYGKGARHRRAARRKTVEPRRAVGIAEHIRLAAKASGLSVNQISLRAGVDQSALNRFLNGTRENIRLDVANRLFQFFGLSVLRPDKPDIR